MTAWATMVGATMAIALIMAYPATIAVLPSAPDLEVHLAGAEPFVVREDATSPAGPIAVSPTPLPEGLISLGPSTAPGLNFRSWQVTYHHRWERGVTLPVLTGPFTREGLDVCGLSVRLGAGLFDTRAAGAGFEGLIRRRAEGAFGRNMEIEGQSIYLPPLKSITLWVEPREDVLEVHVELALVDATMFTARFDARIAVEDGIPIVRRASEPVTTFSGPTRDAILRLGGAAGAAEGGIGLGLLGCLLGPIGCLAGASMGAAVGHQAGEAEANARADAESRAQISAKLDDALAEIGLKLKALGDPWAPFPSRPNDTVRFRLAHAPTVDAGGITLDLCTRIHVGENPVQVAVPGSLNFGAPAPRFDHDLPPASNLVELGANVDAINQLLYFLWQSGELRAIGTAPGLLGAASLPPEMGALAFDLKGFDPGLPPIVMDGPPSSGALRFALGDVMLGDWDGRRVVAHARGGLRLMTENETPRLVGQIDRVDANCTRRTRSGNALTPCVSDIMPVVRSYVATHPPPVIVDGGDLLSKLPTKSFGGSAIQISELRATIRNNPALVNLRVRARMASGP